MRDTHPVSKVNGVLCKFKLCAIHHLWGAMSMALHDMHCTKARTPSQLFLSHVPIPDKASPDSSLLMYSGEGNQARCVKATNGGAA